MDQGAEEDAGGARPSSGFAARWGWVAAVDAVSELRRETWDAVLGYTAAEFLNMLAYRHDKEEKRKQDIEQWRRTH